VRAEPTFLRGVAADLARATDELNELDRAAGDGDLGFTVATIGECVASVAEAARPNEPLSAFLAACSKEIAGRASSTFGTLTAFAFRGASQSATDLPVGSELDTGTLLRLIESGVSEIRNRGKADAGDKTMLDAVTPALEALRTAVDRGLPLPAALRDAAAAAHRGAEATRHMTPGAGRARWLPDRSEGTIDGGAYAVAIGLSSVADRLATT
jgi:dihydroxyacetone kinase-like protein